MTAGKPHAPAVPRRQLNVFLARAIAQYQVGHDDKADAAARKLVDTLRAAGVLSEKPA